MAGSSTKSNASSRPLNSKRDVKKDTGTMYLDHPEKTLPTPLQAISYTGF